MRTQMRRDQKRFAILAAALVVVALAAIYFLEFRA
jgi:hypothetical protein